MVPQDMDKALADALAALGSPTRIAILRELTAPKSLNHIRVAAEDDPARPLSRQAVRAHLDRLVEIAAVLPLASDDGRVGAEYVVDHTRLYALAEDLRALASLRPEDEVARGATSPAALSAGDRGPGGPRFVLVRGLREGTVFPLRRRDEARRGAATAPAWVIGRRRGVDVALDYDPYVSAENAVVGREGAGFTLRDVPGSRNGTQLNFAPIPSDGTPVRLEHGDLVGVGRSVLSFRER